MAKGITCTGKIMGSTEDRAENRRSWPRRHNPPCKDAVCIISSKYFSSPYRFYPQHAWTKERSNYFALSPDSCVGSARSYDWGSAYTQGAVDAFRACSNFQSQGVRHLCERLCYLRAYEPCRKWHELRATVARAGVTTRILNNWSVTIDGDKRQERPWRIFYVSPDGGVFPSAKLALASLGLTGGLRGRTTHRSSLQRSAKRRLQSPAEFAEVSSAPSWRGGEIQPTCGPFFLLKETQPNDLPPSPFGMIEELLYDDPWKVLLGCIMLNQTTRYQVDPVLFRFLAKFPNAAATAAASVADVTEIAGPLGLQEKRPIAIIRFSQEYIRMEWEKPEELHGIGKYAADAYKIFVERRWREVQPTDHALNWWVEWMNAMQAGRGSDCGGDAPATPQTDI